MSLPVQVVDREAFLALTPAAQDEAIEAASAELKPELVKLRKQAILIRRYGGKAEYRQRIATEVIRKRGFYPLAELGFLHMLQTNRAAYERYLATWIFPDAHRESVLQQMRMAEHHQNAATRDYYETYLPRLLFLAPTPEAFAVQAKSEFAHKNYEVLQHIKSPEPREILESRARAVVFIVADIQRQLEPLPRLTSAQVDAETDAIIEKLINEDFID